MECRIINMNFRNKVIALLNEFGVEWTHIGGIGRRGVVTDDEWEWIFLMDGSCFYLYVTLRTKEGGESSIGFNESSFYALYKETGGTGSSIDEISSVDFHTMMYYFKKRTEEEFRLGKSRILLINWKQE